MALSIRLTELANDMESSFGGMGNEKDCIQEDISSKAIQGDSFSAIFQALQHQQSSIQGQASMAKELTVSTTAVFP